MQNVKRSGSRSHSIGTIDNNGNATTLTNRYRGMNLWRSTSLINLVHHGKKKSSVYESTPLITDKIRSDKSNDDEKAKFKSGWSTIVNVVIVKAKGLPAHPDDGSLHTLHCKIKLGSETLKSKSVPNTPQPQWRERFKLHLHKDYLLRISLWDEGKQKNFMGSCVLDLSSLGKECTHEIWQDLDDGYGSIHLTVTMCTIRNSDSTPNNDAHISEDIQEKYGLFNFGEDWKVVGKILVKIISAKGLHGSNVYCALELDNERVQTPSARGSEPKWNKSYFFNIYDITSTLDLKVYENSMVNVLRSECLGEVTIPLLRVRNGETWWYALKDKHKRKIAKGNCPRVQLEMSIVWNPIKATLRLFQPKEVKHIKKPTKFDIALVYKNVEFVQAAFNFLLEINESFKCLFEWEDRQLSFIILSVWLLFCYCIKIWTIPLLCLIPFIYFWMYNLTHKEQLFMRHYGSIEDIEHDNISSSRSSLRKLTERVNNLPEMTLIITNGIDYIVSLAEKMYNLASFKVPFLSYLTILLLIITSVMLYLIPFNYLLMTLGIYKFTRKYLNPERELNNDIIDFLTRIPDNELLKDWRELSVPEPTQNRVTSIGSISTSRS